MPAPVVVQSQLQAMEMGLRDIKRSQLLKQPEVKTMFMAIENHHRDFKLAHLTGKAKDLLQQAEQDTKFYYILVRMLGEVLHSTNGQQRLHSKSVYKWYQNNKHVLHSGPRFGRKNTVTKRSTSHDSLEASFEKLLREIHKAQKVVKPDQFESEFKEDKENMLTDDRDELENKTTTDDDVKKRPHTVADPERRQPAKQKVTSADSYEHLLPKRKTVPLSHLFNPHSRDLSSGALQQDQEETTITLSKVKLKPGVGASQGQQKEDSVGHRKKWDAFQQEYNYGQEMLSKLQYVGRHGVPGGVRYTAHDQGLMAEDYTHNILNGYLQYESHKLLHHGLQKGINLQKEPTPRPKSRLTEPKLEQFYEMADSYYPSKLPKYPSFEKTRSKSAPLCGRPKSGKPRVSSAKLGGKLLETVDLNMESETSKPTDNQVHTVPRSKPKDDKIHVKLDTVVNMIDSVTDEMSYYKEKLAPEPQPGFRQPTIMIDPAQRPHTAPAGSIARPTSPEEYYHYGESSVHRELQAVHGHLLNPPPHSQYTVHSRQDPPPTRSSVIEAIDWRGKVTPEPIRNRPDSVSITPAFNTGWNIATGGSAAHVKKMAHPMSLRTVGTTHGGSRPHTAPTTTQERWGVPQPDEDEVKVSQAASHQAREIDPDTMHSLVQVQHLVGSAKRKRSRHMHLNYEYFLDRDFQPGSSTTQGCPSMEFMAIAAPKSIGGSRPTSPSKSLHEDYDAEACDYPESTDTLTIPSALRDHNGGGDRPDDDSMSRAEFDGPNMADFDEELDDPVQADMHVSGKEACNQNSAPNASGDNNHQLLDEIRNLLGRDSLHDDEQEIVQDPPGQSPTEHVAFQYPQTAIDDERGTFVTASQRAPVSDPQTTDISPNPPSDSRQKQQLSKSTYWNYEPELELGEAALDEHLHDVEKDMLHASPRHHPKTKLGRAFPRAPSAPVHDHRDPNPPELSIEGVGTDMRARSAGTVPARAKSTDRHIVLLKQQEMLRKSPAKAYRTPPSIPSPFNPYGTRSPRRGAAYSTELEMHATKDSSPRHYLQKVGHLRTEEGEPDSVNVNNFTGDLRPLTSSLKVMRMRTKGLREIPSPAEYALQGHPGTPVESLPDEVDGVRQYYSDQSMHDGNPLYPSPVTRSSQEDIGERYLDMGRPIPDYLEHTDPEAYSAAVEKQKEAKAAVNIQRIFRGYVVRNQYKYLQREEREHLEKQRQAAVDIQTAFRRHLARKKAIGRRKPDAETLAWAKEHRTQLIEQQTTREHKTQLINTENAMKKAKSDAKISIIGPHVEVYAPFHPKRTEPEKWVLDAAATAIQRRIRGWLIRVQLNKLKRKAKMHGGNWQKFIHDYRRLLFKIQERLGVNKPKFYFSFDIVNDFMNTKRRYEQIFDKKAFSNELEMDELLQFFQECDLFPAQTEVQDVLQGMLRGLPARKSRGLQKHEVLEIAFQIYPPKGTGIVSNHQSTWMTPIIDGEEALRLMGTDGVEPTDFGTCWNLVSSSHRGRVNADQRRQEAQREEQWAKTHGKQAHGAGTHGSQLTMKKPLVALVEESEESSVQESQGTS